MACRLVGAGQPRHPRPRAECHAAGEVERGRELRRVIDDHADARKPPRHASVIGHHRDRARRGAQHLHAGLALDDASQAASLPGADDDEIGALLVGDAPQGVGRRRVGNGQPQRPGSELVAQDTQPAKEIDRLRRTVGVDRDEQQPRTRRRRELMGQNDGVAALLDSVGPGDDRLEHSANVRAREACCIAPCCGSACVLVRRLRAVTR
jgi:hypothetical protein